MKNANRRTLIIVMVVFILPVVLAKLALETDFFNQAATNQGQLLSPPLSLQTIDNKLLKEKKWQVIFATKEACKQHCENALYALQQVHLALGREMERVAAVAISTEPLPEQNNNTQLLTISEDIFNQVFKVPGNSGIFIADPLGNVMLRFDTEADQKQMVMRSRQILSDLKKLLKLSRIG